MSELIEIRDLSRGFRKLLLVTVSGFALVAGACSTSVWADAETRPTVWIELGGQMELSQGMYSPFTAPFMFINPQPDIYQGDALIQNQHLTRMAFGLEGKVMIHPEGSEWTFSAGIRYGRAHTRRHTHNQAAAGASIHYTGEFHFPGTIYTPGGGYYYGTRVVPISYTKTFHDVPLTDVKTKVDSHQVILDFKAGKDVGIGLFGRNAESNIEMGVRFADFSSNSNTTIIARPSVDAAFVTIPPAKYHLLKEDFRQYTMVARAERSFRGVGPSLSWDASAALLGNSESGEITVDWGLNVAVLFGRQKSRIDQRTQGYHVYFAGSSYHSAPITQHKNLDRGRSILVPNVGGFGGISVKYPNAKVSLGYRTDFFFGAMDTGADVRSTKDVGFTGPYASVSIGLGG